MQGKLIVIEGLDGSGKGTQSRLLYETLQEQGAEVKMVSFPDYQSNSSALVRMYLSGEFGTDPNDVNAYAASVFYAADRFASYKTAWGAFYESGGTIIADRYTTSNAIHQCSKLPQGEWEQYLDWLFDFEYRLLGIPAPDTVIYLQADTEISQKLMSERYHGDESKKDIHESNLDYMRRSRAAAEYCAKRLGWKTVACVEVQRMRSVEEIHKEVINILKI